MTAKLNKTFKKAFTMAEAILVMTILGIIATIMISTLKPAQFKEEGLLIMAKKVLYEIDNAMTQVIVNDTKYGKVNTLNSGGSFIANTADFLTLMKKYMVTTRATVQSSHCSGTGNAVILKNGACMGLKAGGTATDTIFPGEQTAVSKNPTQGFIYFDTNDNKEPNISGKDQFVIPIGDDGIEY